MKLIVRQDDSRPKTINMQKMKEWKKTQQLVETKQMLISTCWLKNKRTKWAQHSIISLPLKWVSALMFVKDHFLIKNIKREKSMLFQPQTQKLQFINRCTKWMELQNTLRILSLSLIILSMRTKIVKTCINMLWKIFYQVSLTTELSQCLLMDKPVQEKHSPLIKLQNIRLMTYSRLQKNTMILNLWCQPLKFMAVNVWICLTTRRNFRF